MAKSKYTNIGGQALLEGVMMRGTEHTAMAVRNTDGDIEIEIYPTVRKQRAAIWQKALYSRHFWADRLSGRRL